MSNYKATLSADERASLPSTAIHEAGHAVAHVRLNIQQGHVTVIPHNGFQGSNTAECDVYNAEAAHDQVIAYCAGYAAMVAAGYPDNVARHGANNDMEHAAQLIDFWSLPHSLAEFQAQAVVFMLKDENIRAVNAVANALIKHGKLSEEYVDVLVDFADGAITEDEWKKFVAWRFPDITAEIE